MAKISAWVRGAGGAYLGAFQMLLCGDVYVGLGDLLRNPVAQHGLFCLATCGPEVSWRCGTL